MGTVLRSAACLAVLFALALTPVGDSVGQEPTEKKVAVAKKKVAAARGRLPAYFAQVVSGEQREAIYQIQLKHAETIKALQEQLAAAIKQRDAEVEAVLTDEQKQKVQDLATEAKKRLDARRAAARAKAPIAKTVAETDAE